MAFSRYGNSRGHEEACDYDLIMLVIRSLLMVNTAIAVVRKGGPFKGGCNKGISFNVDQDSFANKCVVAWTIAATAAEIQAPTDQQSGDEKFDSGVPAIGRPRHICIMHCAGGVVRDIRVPGFVFSMGAYNAVGQPIWGSTCPCEVQMGPTKDGLAPSVTRVAGHGDQFNVVGKRIIIREVVTGAPHQTKLLAHVSITIRMLEPSPIGQVCHVDP